MPPARARRRAADPHPDDAVLAVHDAGLVEDLRTAWKRRQEAGYADDPGQDRVVPYIFPHPGLLDGREAAARGNGVALMHGPAEAAMRRCVVRAENDPLVEFAESQRLRGPARCYADEQ